jgi:hypothetical protein
MCGVCYLVCPQNCKVIRDDLDKAKSLLNSKQEVYASVAPSFLPSFPGASFDTFKKALLQLGFAGAEETAIGATIVKNEYDAMCDDGKHDIIISTCCHSINLLIEKHYPDAGKYLAPVLSPMLAHAQDLKKRHPGCKVVFFGPCISKKNEIEMYPDYDDCVLTFLELEKWLKEKNVVIEKDPNPKKVEESLARLFPIEGGILATMKKDNPNFDYISISGMEEAISAIKDILAGKVHNSFIEMSSCRGSCVNGPAINPDARALVSSYLAIKRSAGKKDFETSSYKSEELKKNMPCFSIKEITPSEAEIKRVLSLIGKTSKKDELNCSSCGYPSCREKAIAVIKGKANLEMCLPFLMEKAKSFSNNIVEGSENGIVVTNEDFIIQLANKSFAKMLNIANPTDLIDKPLDSVLDTELFSLALGGTPIRNKKICLSGLEKYVEASVVYDKQYHIISGTYHDVTELEMRRQKEREMADKAAEITTNVIEKNMRAVQEIASLLGESTAETKVALTQLKDALKKDEKDDDR